MGKISNYEIATYNPEAIVIGTEPESLETKNYRLGDIPQGGGGGFVSGKRGYFYQLDNQEIDIVDGKAFIFNTIDNDLTDGFTVESNGTFPTRIKASTTGVYNLAFSAQLSKFSNNEEAAYIWIKKNGVNVENSAGSVSLKSSNVIAAWNFFIQLEVDDYVEIFWKPSSFDLFCNSFSGSTGVPFIPSVIASINQI